MVGPFALILFGGRLQVRHRDGEVAIDDWIVFKASARTAVLLKEIRNGRRNKILFC